MMRQIKAEIFQRAAPADSLEAVVGDYLRQQLGKNSLVVGGEIGRHSANTRRNRSDHAAGASADAGIGSPSPRAISSRGNNSVEQTLPPLATAGLFFLHCRRIKSLRAILAKLAPPPTWPEPLPPPKPPGEPSMALRKKRRR
jgi:hypothetical protein